MRGNVRIVLYVVLALAAGSTISPPAKADYPGFWGRPYPYGYTWGPRYTFGYAHSCSHLVRVETPNGWHWRRSWSCRAT
jgi:hypothetical protein